MLISQYYFYSEVKFPLTLYIYQKLQMSAVSSWLHQQQEEEALDEEIIS